MPPLAEQPEQLLASVNRRLAELLGGEPPDLATGGADSLADTLWVWGVLGGKEVGKSTLINALAGSDVVDCGGQVGEGTFQPAAYLATDDLAPLQSRLGHLGGLPVTYHARAPQTMRGLVLVDLPDFDSLYEDHVEQVRRIATALDGIIWVTTPKKIGDLRAIREIRRVLKDRGNFVYVLNKVDWLLSQVAGPPLAELERAATALQGQIGESGAAGGAGRTFLVSARYRGSEAIIQAIARDRELPSADDAASGNGELAQAAARVSQDFDALKQALTTAPTADAAAANKQANLTYQVHTQARQLLEHYKPADVLASLERATSGGKLESVAERCLPQAYCRALFRRLDADRRLTAEWSSELFKRRIANWPLVGLVAWPIAALGSVLSGVRSALGGLPMVNPLGPDDPFRLDGLTLEERVEAFLAGVRAELAGAMRHVEITIPEATGLTRLFRSGVLSLAEQRREAAIAPLLHKTPSAFGRLFRWLVPLAVLLWFPLAQPILAGGLALWHKGFGADAGLVLLLVDALSAHNVLLGLAVSLLILAGLAAAVYSGAVRDASVAAERLRNAESDALGEPLTSVLVHEVSRPIEAIQMKLADLTDTLERLAGHSAEAAAE